MADLARGEARGILEPGVGAAGWPWALRGQR